MIRINGIRHIANYPHRRADSELVSAINFAHLSISPQCHGITVFFFGGSGIESHQPLISRDLHLSFQLTRCVVLDRSRHHRPNILYKLWL